MKASSLYVLFGLMAALAGCGSVSNSLGFGRNAPDEFAVVDRPPLAMPPDFDLRPPKPGAPRPQEVAMADRANETLFGGKGAAPDKAGKTTASEAEKAVLDASGAEHADPGIRETVDRETAQKVVGSRHLVEELLWWREPESQATTVDAPAEAQRIQKAKDQGESVDKGATPVIERQKSGWLGL